MEFICFAKGTEQFDVNGKSLGIGEDTAVYYSKSIGRKRFYRNFYPTPYSKSLTLLKFKKEINASKVCTSTNEQFNSNYHPIRIN